MKMSKLPPQILEELIDNTGLKVDGESGLLYGNKSGYDLYLRVPDKRLTSTLTISVSMHGQAPQKDAFKQFVKATKSIVTCDTKGYVVSFSISNKRNTTASIVNIRETMDIILQHLQSYGYINCCAGCSTQTDLGNYVAGGLEQTLCSTCFSNHANATRASQSAERGKRENILAGSVGALLGSLLGVAAIVVIGQMGFVAAISGVIMAVCTFKGYEMLGGKMSKIGIAICSVVMVVMIYMGVQLDWAIFISLEAEVDVFTSFKAIGELIEYEVIEASAFYSSLAMVYIFAAGGAIPTILESFKAKKVAALNYRMEPDFINL